MCLIATAVVMGIKDEVRRKYERGDHNVYC